MASINKLQPGQIVYEVRRQKMGNTNISYGALFTIKIIEVDPEKQWVLASWNGNTARKYPLRSIKTWKVNKPEPKGMIYGTPTYS